jgi:ABC-type nitrate/sulfonate/bicarbonate transport system substrate-binding protein
MITVRLLGLLATMLISGVVEDKAHGQDAKPTIRVHTPGPSILSLGFEVAREEGLYQQEAVNVDLITMASGAGVQALVAGKNWDLFPKSFPKSS